MKKSFMTRVLATGLSFAMAFSMAAATNVTTASAAATEASVTSMMKVASKTVTEGKSVTTYMNSKALKSYRIKKVSLTDVAEKYIEVKPTSSRKGFTIKAKDDAVTNAKLEKKGVNAKIYFSKATTAAKAKKAAASKYANLKVVVKAKEVKPVEVALAIDALTQVKASQLKVTFNKELDAVKTSEFSVIRVDNDAVKTVKAVTLSEDKKSVTVDVYESLTDGKEYKVTYDPTTGDKLDKTITVTDGKVAKITMTPAVATVKVLTEIKYQLFDANGVEIADVKLADKANNIEYSVEYSAAATSYIDGGKLKMDNVDDTATFTIKYRTYDWKDGVEVGAVEATHKVTAVANNITVDGFKMGIADATQKPNFANDTLRDWLAMGDSKTAFFQIKDSNKVDVTATCGYTVESSDPTVILAAGDVKDGAVLTTVKEGTAMLILKDKNDVVKTIPVTVKPQRKLSQLNFDTSTVKINNQAVKDGVQAGVLTVTSFDQYGDKYALSGLSASTKQANDIESERLPGKNKLQFYVKSGETANAGSYTFTVTAEAPNKDDNKITKIEKSLTVQAYDKAKGTTSAAIVFTAGDYGSATANGYNVTKKVDTTVGKDHQDGDTIKVNLVDLRNGVVDGAYTGANTVSAIYVEKVGVGVIAQTGTAVKTVKTCAAIKDSSLNNTYDALSLDDAKDSGKELVINVAGLYGNTTNGAHTSGSKYIEKHLGTGTYRVTYSFNDGKKAVATFDIEDSQAKVTANVKKTTYDGSSAAALLADKDYITFSYGSDELLRDDVKLYDGVTCTGSNIKMSKDTLVINKVNVYANLETFGVSGVSYDVYVKASDVVVNKTFKTTTGGDWTS